MNRVEPLTVSALTAQIKEILEDQVGEVLVAGEISNLRHQSSGHYYFTLKDEGSQIPCALFKGSALRLAVQPKDGAKVVAEFCDDQTPPEEFAKARVQPVQEFLPRAKGLGRPTKRERREIDQLFEKE